MDFKDNQTSFLERIREYAIAKPMHDALVSDDRAITYKELFQLVMQGVSTLEGRNIGKSSVVGLSVEDQMTHLIISLSLLALGAKQITLASHDSEATRMELAKFVGVTEVITQNSRYQLEGVGSLAISATMFLEQTVKQKGEFDHDVVASHDEQIYLRTSGTTDGVCVVGYSQHQLSLQAPRLEGIEKRRLLKLASIEHNNSKRHRLFCVYQGGANIFRHADSLVGIVQFCGFHKVSSLDVTRMHIADLLRTHSKNNLRFPKGVKIISAGSGVPSELRKAMIEVVSDEFYVRYGATECGSIALASPEHHYIEGAVGRVVDGVEVEIVGLDNKVLPVGSIGEVRIKAEGVADNYYANTKKTAVSFRNGWFYPGDSGSFNEDGVLIIHGRHDDMMIMNGLNIFPSEIESSLEQHSLVRSAVAVAIPSTVHGEIPVAVVELVDEAEVSMLELKAYAREKLALKAPRKIVVLPIIPYSKAGKVDKRKIVKMFQKQI
ncbi:MAG: fatty acid--CoA ligase family protein [Cycloclasticus sp.]|nr:fatty acid--CoA ligase family protein [Cycloclasticus sp.]